MNRKLVVVDRYSTEHDRKRREVERLLTRGLRCAYYGAILWTASKGLEGLLKVDSTTAWQLSLSGYVVWMLSEHNVFYKD